VDDGLIQKHAIDIPTLMGLEHCGVRGVREARNMFTLGFGRSGSGPDRDRYTMDAWRAAPCWVPGPWAKEARKTLAAAKSNTSSRTGCGVSIRASMGHLQGLQAWYVLASSPKSFRVAFFDAQAQP
jgi:hypothetical protein